MEGHRTTAAQGGTYSNTSTISSNKMGNIFECKTCHDIYHVCAKGFRDKCRSNTSTYAPRAKFNKISVI